MTQSVWVFLVGHFFSLMPAFHILNNTTIQFKLEKIPIERESELTFSLSPDDLGASSIMKIEGKFVNPVQVSTLLIFLSGQLKSCNDFVFVIYMCYVYVLLYFVYIKCWKENINSKRYCSCTLLSITCSNKHGILLSCPSITESVFVSFFMWRGEL